MQWPDRSLKCCPSWCCPLISASWNGKFSPYRAAPSHKLNDNYVSSSPTDSLQQTSCQIWNSWKKSKGNKIPIPHLAVNCKSWCHFSWCSNPPLSATRPIICRPVIHLVTSFSPHFPHWHPSFTLPYSLPLLYHSTYPIPLPLSSPHLPSAHHVWSLSLEW